MTRDQCRIWFTDTQRHRYSAMY